MFLEADIYCTYFITHFVVIGEITLPQKVAL